MSNKLIVKIFIITTFLFNLKHNIYGISDNFKFVIDTIGIPRYNVYYEEINEDIYDTYRIFVYSNPQNLLWHGDQRFKTVVNFGKWTRNSGVYKGFGDRGEYYLLGTSYSGSVISNVYFPADFCPETTPDKWIYLVTSGAYESWKNEHLYKYGEQLEYMKNTDLLFDEINITDGTINSYNLVSYNISASKIGTNKLTLNAVSTWKTNGIVTARRLTSESKIRNAIFATAPMSANASISSKIDVVENITMQKNEDKISIPITMYGKAINLSEYAKPKHIKEIVSILYINNKEVTRVSGSKTIKVDKKFLFTVSREDYKISKTYPIDIKVKSYLYTEFSTDGLMQDEVHKTIYLQVLEKEVIPVNSIEVAVLEKDNNNLVVRPLIQNLNTKEDGSEGIIEAGKYLALKLEKNVDDIDMEVFINDKLVDYEMIYSNTRYEIIKVSIDENMKNTIISWNYLRDKFENYFDVDFSQIGERITTPNVVKIVCNSNYNKLIKFDSIDKYSNNMNYIFNNNVLNINEISRSISIENWAEDD
jgi:hypothetical protein